jgi:aryl-alcohol dehydrogenase-like predicted oxidoreductase
MVQLVETRPLGQTGLELTRIGLGCGNFGGIGSAPQFFGQGENRDEAFALLDTAFELGINVLDTADAYGGGRSESWIGEWLRAQRRRMILSTKVFHSVHGDAADRGLARARVLRRLDESLERLGVERVDMYLVHEPDPETPLEETMAALDELARAGKVGAIGASNVDRAWLEKSLAISAREGFARVEWVQNSYSLLDRAAESEVLPFCAERGLGFTPFSPLAGGWLTGKYRQSEPAAPGSRMTMRPEPYVHLDDDAIYRGLDSLREAATQRAVDMPTLAFAWLLSHPQVTTVIAGPRRPEQLEPARRALDVELSPAERDELASLVP